MIGLLKSHFGRPLPCGSVGPSLSYTLQLYFDFSGYTDRVLGGSLLFNIKLPINFNSPYRSFTIQEFWRRWHMTLSRFIRDDIYIPLGGSRGSEVQTFLIILATFFLVGLWQGAGWTFVIWGLLHGFASSRSRRPKGLKKISVGTGLRGSAFRLVLPFRIDPSPFEVAPFNSSQIILS